MPLPTARWVKPSLTITFSSFSSVCRPISPPFPFARPHAASLVLNPTSHHTNIHPSKQTPSCMHNFHCRSRHSPTHLSLLTATLLLCEDIQPNPGPTHPANLLLCTLNTPSMLSPEHATALNDLTDNHKPDIIAHTETWIRSSTIPAELIDSTPPAG